MPTRTDSPKVFISYSWTSVAHEIWVRELAEKLMSDGVLVTLDKWDLKEGQDKYSFMEQMVNNPEIRKVLIVCDKEYADKADLRKGGAGTESQIISSEIYNKVNQEKFIPVLRQFDDLGNPCLPIYLKNRIYIDLSDDSKYHEEYEKLLRNIFGRPLLKRPPVGSPPSYLFSDEPTSLLTTHRLKTFKDAFVQDKPATKTLFVDYLTTVLETIKQEKIIPKSGEFIDDLVTASIENLIIQRDEFVELVDFLVKNDCSVEYHYALHNFFSSLLELTETANFPEAPELDNFRFVQYELFVYLIAVLIQNRNSKAIDIFCDEDYFYKSRYRREKKAFNAFNRYTESLNKGRNLRLKLNRISLQADLLVQRANNTTAERDRFIEADFILFMRSILCPREGLRYWYPRTVIYTTDSILPFETFHKALSPRNYEFIQSIFKFTQIEDFISRLKDSGHEQILHEHYFQSYHSMDEFIGLSALYSRYKTDIGM